MQPIQAQPADNIDFKPLFIHTTPLIISCMSRLFIELRDNKVVKSLFIHILKSPKQEDLLQDPKLLANKKIVDLSIEACAHIRGLHKIYNSPDSLGCSHIDQDQARLGVFRKLLLDTCNTYRRAFKHIPLAQLQLQPVVVPAADVSLFDAPACGHPAPRDAPIQVAAIPLSPSAAPAPTLQLYNNIDVQNFALNFTNLQSIKAAYLAEIPESVMEKWLSSDNKYLMAYIVNYLAENKKLHILPLIPSVLDANRMQKSTEDIVACYQIAPGSSLPSFSMRPFQEVYFLGQFRMENWTRICQLLNVTIDNVLRLRPYVPADVAIFQACMMKGPETFRAALGNVSVACDNLIKPFNELYPPEEQYPISQSALQSVNSSVQVSPAFSSPSIPSARLGYHQSAPLPVRKPSEAVINECKLPKNVKDILIQYVRRDKRMGVLGEDPHLGSLRGTLGLQYTKKEVKLIKTFLRDQIPPATAENIKTMSELIACMAQRALIHDNDITVLVEFLQKLTI